MNYQLHYAKLVSRAVTRELAGYSERHHIVPRCMGGGNEETNLVRLTPEEHYVAHQLLVKMNTGIDGLVRAAYMMSTNRHGTRANNKRFGWLRRLFADVSRCAATGKTQTAESRAKKSAALKGRIFSAETKAKISAAITGDKNPMFGKTPSAKRRAQSGAAMKGKHHTAETRSKISASQMGRPGMFGEDNPFFGQRHSPETKAKLSAMAKARQQSKEN